MPAIFILPPLIFIQLRCPPLLGWVAGAFFLALVGCVRVPRALWPQLAVRLGGRLMQRSEPLGAQRGEPTGSSWEFIAATRLWWPLGQSSGSIRPLGTTRGGGLASPPGSMRVGVHLGRWCLGLWLACEGGAAAQSEAGSSPPLGLGPPAVGKPLSLADAATALPLSEWRWVLRRYRHEPTIAEVVALARRHRHAAGLSELSALAHRSRWRGAVPRLSVSMRHGQAQDYVDTQVNVGNRLRVASDRDLAFQVELLFDLPSLVASDDEAALLRLRHTELRVDGARVQQLVKLYFERRRLQILRDIGLRADVRTQIRIVEIEALLDDFTGNAFSRMIQRPRTAR